MLILIEDRKKRKGRKRDGGGKKKSSGQFVFKFPYYMPCESANPDGIKQYNNLSPYPYS